MSPSSSPTQFTRVALTCVLAATAFTAAQADSKRAVVPPLLKYQQECAACHIAYPPGMLPASSWARMMGSLDKHYGADASLDEASVREITGWLKAHAGTYKGVREEPPQDLITKSAWFLREHRKIDPQVWKHASVKSAANCAACHTRADRGDYSERSITFPVGLDGKYRRGWSD